MKRITNIHWKALIIAILGTLLVWTAYAHLNDHTNQERVKKQLITEIQKKEDELNKNKTTSQELLQQKQKEIEELKKQVKAKQEAKVYAESLKSASVSHVEAPRSDNYYKQYIYDHESGNRTTAVNSIGCRGLGQACPGSKLPCGADYACQDAYFTNYAISRYGSWANAYSFWVRNHWW